MITELLQQEFVLKQAKSQRDWLVRLQKEAAKKTPAALAAMKKQRVTPQKLAKAIHALNVAIKRAEKDKKHGKEGVFIPSNPLLCGFQTGVTELAKEHQITAASAASTSASAPTKSARRGATAKKAAGKRKVLDTTASLSLKKAPKRKPAGKRKAVRRAAFVEGNLIEGGDIHYGLDGFNSKLGAIFRGIRAFNKAPAEPKTARTKLPLRLFVLGDWGTGLPLAREVTKRINEQLEQNDGSRMQHVIHLGDVYYCGEAHEYENYVFPWWPQAATSKPSKIGSWSLNGNHDRYSGNHAYFDVLLSSPPFQRWHADASGKPSSFFLIENDHWQVFGLDTSYKLPALTSALFGDPTMKDYGGQNGILTPEQVSWMASMRDKNKGCILFTHHQPASSRQKKVEGQHADEAIKLMKKAGVYDQIDAWIWGHEHRGVVFKPKSERKDAVLKNAPPFCACVGHSGVPVTEKNFEAKATIPDVHWQEDRLDASSPIYEKKRIIPFGFARMDLSPGSFEFVMYDHEGTKRITINHQR